MTLYHRTTAAAAILADGFRDRTAKYMTGLHTGVAFADWPDVTEARASWALLAIDIPDTVLERYEWEGDATQGYREWLIPAAVANKYGPPRLVSPEEEREILDPPR